MERGRRAALEVPRCANARQLPHEQPEIEPAGVHEHALQDVGMSAQVHSAHTAGFAEMRIGPFKPFKPFAALPQQALPARAPNPPGLTVLCVLTTKGHQQPDDAGGVGWVTGDRLGARPKGRGTFCRGCTSSGAERAGASTGADPPAGPSPADLARHGKTTP